MFTYESKINSALRNIEGRKIFLDVSKDLNSYKFSKHTKADYEKLQEGMSDMFELASSIILAKKESHDDRLRKELKEGFTQISKFMDETNQKILNDRKTVERILLQKDFSSKIPKAGHLKA